MILIGFLISFALIFISAKLKEYFDPILSLDILFFVFLIIGFIGV